MITTKKLVFLTPSSEKLGVGISIMPLAALFFLKSK